MSTKTALPSLLFLVLLVATAGNVFTNTNGSPSARSGGAGEASCATSSCHVGTVNSGPGLVNLTSDAPGGVYTPGNTYTITATVEQSGINKFGFQVLSAYNSVSNASLGTAAVISSGETKLTSSGQRRYVTHVSGGTAGTNSRSWSFNWTAPASGGGDVTFFMAGNAANNNGNRTGDLIYTTSLSLMEAAVNVEDAFRNTSLELYPTLADEKIVVSLEDAGLSGYLVQVLNQQGQVIREESIQPVGSSVKREIQVSSYAAGMYYLRVIGEQFQDTRKFVKF